jgi:DNA-3-methyladenine glycosylase II
VRTLLDDETLLAGVRALIERDAALAQIVDRYGPPPLWSRTQGFSTLARIILEQQVSLASGRALFERLEQQLTGGFRPPAVLTVGEAGLRSLGVTRQKAAYLVALADRVTASELWFEELSMLEDEQALGRLCEVRGVGSWTASIYLLMALLAARRPRTPEGAGPPARSVRHTNRGASRRGRDPLEALALRSGSYPLALVSQRPLDPIFLLPAEAREERCGENPVPQLAS